MISFIIPLRDRESQVSGLIFNISKYYQDYEIILANQADNTTFKHGQLRNLGYKKSKGEIVVFIDVDVRFLSFIDFVSLQSEHNHSLLMFNQVYEAREKRQGEFEVQKARSCIHCVGRMLCFTRKQFEECGGYSNLCAGWSWEDNLLYRRARPIKIEGEIAHISHSYQRDEMKCRDRNKSICDSDSERDSSLDGFRQTIAKEGSLHIYSKVARYIFFDITVPENFVYKNLLQEAK